MIRIVCVAKRGRGVLRRVEREGRMLKENGCACGLRLELGGRTAATDGGGAAAWDASQHFHMFVIYTSYSDFFYIFNTFPHHATNYKPPIPFGGER